MRNAVLAIMTFLTFSNSSMANPCDPILKNRDHLIELEDKIEHDQVLYAQAHTDEEKARLIDQIIIPATVVSTAVGIGGALYYFAASGVARDGFTAGRWIQASEASKTTALWVTGIAFVAAGGLLLYKYFDTPEAQVKKTADAVTEYMNEVTESKAKFEKLYEANEKLALKYNCLNLPIERTHL